MKRWREKVKESTKRRKKRDLEKERKIATDEKNILGKKEK